MPNVFFRRGTKKNRTGTIILPCEREGCNAVFAAQLGWNVKAFDFSESGKQKAETLAQQKQVTINYSIKNISDAQYDFNSVNVVSLIVAPFSNI